LDEEVEGMQSTIQLLQRELAAAKQENEEYKKVIEDYEKSMNFKKENDTDIKMEYVDRSSVVSGTNDSDNEADYEMADVDQRSDVSYEAAGSRRTSSQRSYDNPDSDRESDPDNENYLTTEEINSPDTPTSENARNRTHASLSRSSSHEQTDDVIEGVTTRSGDAWDDRTSNVSGKSEGDDQIEVEVENEEVASSTDVSDEDIINTHNQHVTPRTSPRTDSDYERSPLVYDKPVKDNSTNQFSNEKNNISTNSSPISEPHRDFEYHSASHQSTQNAMNQPVLMANKATLLAFITKNYPELGSTMDVNALMDPLQSPTVLDSNGEYDLEAIRRIVHQVLLQREQGDRTRKEEPEARLCGTSPVSNNHARDAVNGVDESDSH